MKPVLIYTMPRTKGNATLEACKRTHKFNEPFEVNNLPNLVGPLDSYINVVKTLVEYDGQDDLFNKLNTPDSACKIFGHGLTYYYPARSWFSMAQQTHDVFILVRNVREMIISELLAPHFGYTRSSSKEDRPIEIKEQQFALASQIIFGFLRFYPANGRLITFETLPTDYFDKSLIVTENQYSQSKFDLITNSKEVQDNIQAIMAFHDDEWKEKTGFSIFA